MRYLTRTVDPDELARRFERFDQLVAQSPALKRRLIEVLTLGEQVIGQCERLLQAKRLQFPPDADADDA